MKIEFFMGCLTDRISAAKALARQGAAQASRLKIERGACRR